MNNSQSDIRIEISDVTEPQENLAPPQFHSLIRKASYSAVTQDVPVSDSTSNLIDLTQITCPICKKDLTAKDSIPLKKIKPRFLRLLKSNFSCDLSDPNIRGIDHLI